MKIAFLGLGNMGSGMAARMLAAGHPLTVWNRTAEKASPLVAEGAALAKEPEEAVAGAEVVISCLMDDTALRAMFDPAGRVLGALPPGAIHLCVSTISPSCADWLAETHAAHGSLYVSGPVVGRPDAVRAGTVMQFLAGDAVAIERVEPLCAAFVARSVRIPGAASRANKQKLCINFFIVSLIEAMAENYTFADKIGASREIMAGFFDGVFAAPGIKGYARRMFERSAEGEDGFSMKGGLKDVSLILGEARRAGCPLELADVIEGKMREAIEQGMEGKDWSAIQEISRRRAGLE